RGRGLRLPPALYPWANGRRSLRNVQLGRRGTRQELVSARGADGRGTAPLLRRTLRHRGGRFAVLSAAVARGRDELGRADTGRIRVPREGVEADDGTRGDGFARARFRGVPRVARPARGGGEAARRAAAVPPALREVARRAGRAARSRRTTHAPRSVD